jgi:hypothetical protein
LREAAKPVNQLARRCNKATKRNGSPGDRPQNVPASVWP